MREKYTGSPAKQHYGLEEIIDVARGEVPADLLLVNARVVNVFTGEVLESAVAVQGGTIAGVGDYDRGGRVVDLGGCYLLPGLIDGHIHIESTMLSPPGFAAAVVPHGTTAVVSDPHEIVNVAGMEGLDYMVEASRGLPLDIFYMVPSCVPATSMETAGAAFGLGDLRKALDKYRDLPGLGEMMNFPGVLFKVPEVLDKIREVRRRGGLVDGHSPLLGGRDLNAYLAAGILTDHECTRLEEAREKLRLGMKIMIREGSAARNLQDLLPLVNERNLPNIFFCCDDRHPGDLIQEGEMDNILRKAVALGLDPVMAVQMATLNPAVHYKLSGYGAVAPGYRADLVVVNDLRDFQVEDVYKGGRLVARRGELLVPLEKSRGSHPLQGVHLPPLQGRLELVPPPGARYARVMVAHPEQIITGSHLVPAAGLPRQAGLARVAVVERYGRSGNIGLGLVQGFGPLEGALASTVAHDSHNLILVGSNTADMEVAAREVARGGGGLAVVSRGRLLAYLPLVLGGIMSDQDAGTVDRQHRELHQAAHGIGCQLPSPFMTMSFLALPVIPELKITDQGLVDVNLFQPVDLWVT